MCAYRSLRERVTKLWSITCHMESRSFSFHPGQMNALLLNLSQTGRYSIYVPQKEEKLSWYWCWLHIYSVHVDGLPVHTVTHGLSSNHLIAARLEVVPMTSRSDTLSLLYQATTCPRSYFCLIHHDAFVYPSQHGNADTVVRAMSVKCNKWWLRGRGGVPVTPKLIGESWFAAYSMPGSGGDDAYDAAGTQSDGKRRTTGTCWEESDERLRRHRIRTQSPKSWETTFIGSPSATYCWSTVVCKASTYRQSTQLQWSCTGA